MHWDPSETQSFSPSPSESSGFAGWGVWQLHGEGSRTSACSTSLTICIKFLSVHRTRNSTLHKICTTISNIRGGLFRGFDLEISFLIPLHFKDSTLYLPMISLRSHSWVRVTRSHREKGFVCRKPPVTYLWCKLCRKWLCHSDSGSCRLKLLLVDNAVHFIGLIVRTCRAGPKEKNTS